MPKILIRIVAFLLIPNLMAQSIRVSDWRMQTVEYTHSAIKNPRAEIFNDQALVERLTFVQRIIRGTFPNIWKVRQSPPRRRIFLPKERVAEPSVAMTGASLASFDRMDVVEIHLSSRDVFLNTLRGIWSFLRREVPPPKVLFFVQRDDGLKRLAALGLNEIVFFADSRLQRLIGCLSVKNLNIGSYDIRIVESGETQSRKLGDVRISVQDPTAVSLVEFDDLLVTAGRTFYVQITSAETARTIYASQPMRYVEKSVFLKRSPSRLAMLATQAVLRLFDITVATLAIIVLLPIEIPLAIVLANRNGWPIFYTDQREDYKVYKLRTIKKALTEANANRTTGIVQPGMRMGKFEQLVRTLGPDEFPQVFLILLGRWSFVGPRSLGRTSMGAHYERVRASLEGMKPGAISTAQILGGRGPGGIHLETRILNNVYDRQALRFFSYICRLIIRMGVTLLMLEGIEDYDLKRRYFHFLGFPDSDKRIAHFVGQCFQQHLDVFSLLAVQAIIERFRERMDLARGVASAEEKAELDIQGAAILRLLTVVLAAIQKGKVLIVKNRLTLEDEFGTASQRIDELLRVVLPEASPLDCAYLALYRLLREIRQNARPNTYKVALEFGALQTQPIDRKRDIAGIRDMQTVASVFFPLFGVLPLNGENGAPEQLNGPSALIPNKETFFNALSNRVVNIRSFKAGPRRHSYRLEYERLNEDSFRIFVTGQFVNGKRGRILGAIEGDVDTNGLKDVIWHFTTFQSEDPPKEVLTRYVLALLSGQLPTGSRLDHEPLDNETLVELMAEFPKKYQPRSQQRKSMLSERIIAALESGETIPSGTLAQTSVGKMMDEAGLSDHRITLETHPIRGNQLIKLIHTKPIDQMRKQDQDGPARQSLRAA